MKICKVDGCGVVYKKGIHFENGYCNKHNLHIKRNGKILERTRNDKNSYIIRENIVIMDLYNIRHEKVTETIFDVKILDNVIKHKWCLNYGYATTTLKDRKRLFLHHIALPKKENIFTDHKNSNRLDNRSINLRYCTIQENNRNKYALGVRKLKCFDTWQARINVNKKEINLGYYKNKEDALKARKEGEIKYFKEFAYANNKNDHRA